MAAISLLISVALIWWLFFWLYRDYRHDLCRQKLFEVRDQLFDLAADGKLSFDSPSYIALRGMINGAIQRGHTFGLIDAMAMYCVTRDKALQREATKYSERLLAACNESPVEVRETLKRIRSRVHFIFAEQVIVTSAVLTFTLITIVLTAIVWVANRMAFSFAQKCFDGAVTKVAYRVEYAASVLSGNHAPA